MCIYVPTYTHVCPCMAAYIHVYIYTYIHCIHSIHLIILYKLRKGPTGCPVIAKEHFCHWLKYKNLLFKLQYTEFEEYYNLKSIIIKSHIKMKAIRMNDTTVGLIFHGYLGIYL